MALKIAYTHMYSDWSNIEEWLAGNAIVLQHTLHMPLEIYFKKQFFNALQWWPHLVVEVGSDAAVCSVELLLEPLFDVNIMDRLTTIFHLVHKTSLQTQEITRKSIDCTANGLQPGTCLRARWKASEWWPQWNYVVFELLHELRLWSRMVAKT